METSVDSGYVQALIDGDPAVERHFAAHFGRLLLIKLRRRRIRADDIDDIRQETFTRVFATLRGPGLRDRSCLGGFINSVCDNVILERWRRDKREPLAVDPPDDPPDARASVEAELVRGDLVREVRRILERLSVKDQAILRAVLCDGRDRDMVCAEHGIDRDYLRVLLHRAKERFREHFESSSSGGGAS